MVSGSMFLNPFSNLGKVLILLPDVISFAEVDKIDDWFRGQEEQRVDNLDLYRQATG